MVGAGVGVRALAGHYTVVFLGKIIYVLSRCLSSLKRINGKRILIHESNDKQQQGNYTHQ